MGLQYALHLHFINQQGCFSIQLITFILGTMFLCSFGFFQRKIFLHFCKGPNNEDKICMKVVFHCGH